MSVRSTVPPIRSPRAVCSVVLASSAFLLAGAPAAHAVFSGGTADPAGDSADPSPARDILTISASYDRKTGYLEGSVRLAGDPTSASDARVALYAGVRTATGCDGYPAISLQGRTAENLDQLSAGANPVSLLASSATDVFSDRAFRRRGPANAPEFWVTDDDLAGKPADCLTAALTDPDDPTKIFDQAGPVPMTGRPELTATLGAVPSAVKPGQRRRVRLQLRNPGEGATGPIRLRVGRARGLTTKAPRTLKSLRPGALRTVTVEVRLSRRAAASTRLRLTAEAGTLSARDDAPLYLRKPTPAPKPGGGGGSGTTTPDYPQTCTFVQSDGTLGLRPC